MRSLMLIPAITLLLVATGCDWMPGKPTKAEEQKLPSDVHAFNTLYANNCSGCHGANGQFGPARPLNDPLYLSLADDDYLVEVSSSGVPHSLMPAFGTESGGDLTDEQVGDVVHGIRRSWGGHPTSIDATTPPPLTSTTPGVASRGATVFTTHCATCHGTNGDGGDVAGSIVDDSFLSMVTDQALRTAIICGRLDLGMPDYSGQLNGQPAPQRRGLRPLDDQQVSDLVAWLVSHRQEFPGAPFPSLEHPRGSGTTVP